MEKIIIGIHGIGNKPPADILQDWWLSSINDGLKRYNYPAQQINFELVYWADILHESPLNPEEVDKKNTGFMDEKYSNEDPPSPDCSINFRQRAINYIEKYYDRLVINGVLSLDNVALTELFIHLHMKDLERYYSKSYIDINGKKVLIRDAIIERLINRLKKHRDKKILLIAHSMGSVITHDALIENTPGLEIDTLVTIGSPLGQRYVIDNYKKEEKEKSINKLNVPGNIRKHWYNLSDTEDQVAINHKLSEFYKISSNGLTIIDKLVKNNYSYKGNINPHKSFGYLRTPEISGIIYSFRSSWSTKTLAWLKNKFSGNAKKANR